MKTYKNLNDAACYVGEDIEQGETEIWYQRPEQFGELTVHPTNLKETHILLGKVKSERPDNIFNFMQGEHWSPNGEARELIESLGLEHTSMSTGDVVRTGGKTYFCEPFGWSDLTGLHEKIDRWLEINEKLSSENTEED